MHLDKCPCFVPLDTPTHTRTHAQTHAHLHTFKQKYVCMTFTCFSFAPETVSASNEKACGQAVAQLNEMATEALAVFDLPPLTQRDHLIN